MNDIVAAVTAHRGAVLCRMPLDEPDKQQCSVVCGRRFRRRRHRLLLPPQFDVLEDETLMIPSALCLDCESM